MKTPRRILRAALPLTLAMATAALFALPAEAGRAKRTRSSSSASSATTATRTTVPARTSTATRTRVPARSHHRTRVHVGFGYRYWPHYGYGYGYWPRVWVGGYYGYQGYYPRGYYAPYDSRRLQPVGWLDLDVRPRTTEIYVDGEYVGLARNFDGYPGYLWLEPGQYEVAFYRDGYRTVTRTLTITDGEMLEVRERLKKGESVRPEPPPEKPQPEAAAPAGGDEGEESDGTGAILTFPRRTGNEPD